SKPGGRSVLPGGAFRLKMRDCFTIVPSEGPVMFLNSLLVFAENTPDPGASTSNPLSMLFPFLLIIPLFYFLMIRPARRQEKERQSLIGNTKKNDKVLTSSGIFGTVVQFGD